MGSMNSFLVKLNHRLENISKIKIHKYQSKIIKQLSKIRNARIPLPLRVFHSRENSRFPRFPKNDYRKRSKIKRHEVLRIVDDRRSYIQYIYNYEPRNDSL